MSFHATLRSGAGMHCLAGSLEGLTLPLSHQPSWETMMDPTGNFLSLLSSTLATFVNNQRLTIMHVHESYG